MRKFIVTVNGSQYEVGVEEVADGGVVTPVVQSVAPAAAAPVAPAPVAAAPAAPAAVTSGTEMRSPMPGIILELKVAEGAEVKEGDVVVVLEAMKMANDLTAPASGKISFRVAKGANVDSDELLAVIG